MPRLHQQRRAQDLPEQLWPAKLAPFLVWAMLTLPLLLVAFKVYRLDAAHQYEHLGFLARERTSLLGSAINLRFQPVRHVAAVFEYQKGDISEDSFRMLVDSIPLARDPGLAALQWIPRSVDSSGKESFVIRYSYGRGPKPPPAGKNLLADPFQRAELEKVPLQIRIFVTPWYWADGELRLRVLRPLFETSGPNGRRLVGFVSGVYRVEPLLAGAFARTDSAPVELFISSGNLPGFFRYANGMLSHVAGLPADIEHRKQVKSTIHLPGTSWRVITVALDGSYSPSLLPPILIGLSGFLFGTILALYLRSLLTRNRLIRQLVDQRTHDLERQAERLRLVNAELEEFAYVASHDLKAPLRAVANLAAWIDEDQGERLDEENRNRLRLMRERVFRMDDLIEGLLAYARAGRVTGSQRVPLRPLLEEVIGELPVPGGFRVELQGAFPTIQADPLHLRQIFQNLISNAIAHHDAPEHGLVQIRAHEEPRFWHFEVADNGPGIPAGNREQVFRMFTTLGGASGIHHTGIGLAVVRKLVYSYGGRIKVTDNVPRGAVFHVYWPK